MQFMIPFWLLIIAINLIEGITIDQLNKKAKDLSARKNIEEMLKDLSVSGKDHIQDIRGNGLHLKTLTTDKTGSKHMRYQQEYEGLPIFGFHIIVRDTPTTYIAELDRETNEPTERMIKINKEKKMRGDYVDGLDKELGKMFLHPCRCVHMICHLSFKPLPPTSTPIERLSQEVKETEIWDDPWRHAFGIGAQPKYTQIEESKEEWRWVERLMPPKVVPEPPKHDKYPTPSGWKLPQYPPPDFPYYVRRDYLNLFPLYLETRRDQLDTYTMEFNYVELVVLVGIQGDVFACENDLRNYLEEKVCHPVATNVNEAQGKIRVKGADRSLLEQFLMEKGF